MSETKQNLPVPARGGDEGTAIVPQKSASARPAPQKAAALLALLDDRTLNSLAGRLPERHRDRLLNSVMAMRSVTVSEQQKIAKEFAVSFKQQQNAVRGNQEVADRLVSTLYEDDDDDGFALPTMQPEDLDQFNFGNEEASLWERVGQLDPNKLADFFTDKPAAVLSIVLQKLPDDAASELTGALPEDIARQAMLQVATAGPINPLAIEAVEQLVENELFKEDDGEDDARNESTQKIANILNRLTSTRREAILDALKGTLSPEDLEDIASKVLSFEALEDRLPRNAIPILFREVPEKLLLTAIQYALSQTMPIGEFLLKNISQRMATQYREKMDELPTINTEDGEKSQSAVICKVLEMAEEGQIRLLEASDEGAD
ncbi:MAG: FliG C-terminal domain-containing protein [Pseudomonadota bacterium]